jgi:hypothetical protein
VELIDLLAASAMAEAQETGELATKHHSPGRGTSEPGYNAHGHGSPASPPVPKRAGRLFRQWLFLHALVDRAEDLDCGLLAKVARSMARYRQARRYAAGAGPVPAIGPADPRIDFASVAGIGHASDEALEPLCRAMRVKLDAQAFGGPAYYRCSLLQGMTALWLLPALTGWFGRLEAASAGRSQLNGDDVLAGLRRASCTFGVSPVFGRFSERMRLKALSNQWLPRALLCAYGP